MLKVEVQKPTDPSVVEPPELRHHLPSRSKGAGAAGRAEQEDAWHGVGKSTAVVSTRRQAAQLLSLLDLSFRQTAINKRNRQNRML
jgi:hypothetical protein